SNFFIQSLLSVQLSQATIKAEPQIAGILEYGRDHCRLLVGKTEALKRQWWRQEIIRHRLMKSCPNQTFSILIKHSYSAIRQAVRIGWMSHIPYETLLIAVELENAVVQSPEPHLSVTIFEHGAEENRARCVAAFNNG